MQLPLVLGVLIALVAAQSGPAEPLRLSGWWWTLTISLVALAPLAAFVGAGAVRWNMGHGSALGEQMLGRLDRLRRWHMALWLVSLAVVYLALGWPQLVRFNWRLDGVPLLSALLMLAPLVGSLILSWAAFYEIERPWIPHGRLRHLGLVVRTELMLLLAPALAILTLSDLVELAWPESGVDAGFLLAPLLVGLLILLPELIRRLWSTAPLAEGLLRRRLTTLSQRAGFTCREILVWRTGGAVINAATTGFVRRFRYVLLSDGLLLAMNDRQIEAVHAHEMAHIRLHHLPLRTAAILLPVALWTALESAWGGTLTDFAGVAGYTGPGDLTTRLASAALLLSAVGLYGWFVFGAYSRRLEHQADWYACELLAEDATIVRDETSEVTHGCDARLAATGCVAGMLARLANLGGQAARRRSWLHPSIDDRIAFVHRLTSDLAAAARFRQTTRCLGWLICLTTLALLATAIYLAA